MVISITDSGEFWAKFSNDLFVKAIAHSNPTLKLVRNKFHKKTLSPSCLEVFILFELSLNPSQLAGLWMSKYGYTNNLDTETEAQKQALNKIDDLIEYLDEILIKEE